ncbi:MAG: lipoate--protein ligase family protein [Candidatus Bipolaricaulota bacterium]|nr:lipoate--protein ligase family protein [Candidatus Bipolaricaulota bacterium]MCS7274721.1 lipoate--protein ligase family protein [Candidatus Bipolaricaulota bacterium]MDW8109998.1 biotin/lipoate A/B protein ligase family protein [Candidatus Bipolaricaulota bacterium]MDW8328930.1 biotin/lipoate A/B protein ligase family protein [Candidatus Bipolaricaulota bacterium]
MLWRVLDTGVGSAPWNMAVDEALLRSCDAQPHVTLRLYQWERPTLSLGYFQDLSEIDLEECARRGFDWVRRPTGGRAVLHHDELTYSFVAPIALLGESVARSHEQISRALALGLERLGLRAEFAHHRERSPDLSAVCFATPAPVELSIQNKKVIGSAQVRTQRSLLQHGSIPLSIDFEALAAVLKISDPRARSLLRQRAAGLREFRAISREALRAAIRSGFEEHFRQKFTVGTLTAEEEAHARELLRRKYATHAWNRHASAPSLLDD